jgi:hypothetical protein
VPLEIVQVEVPTALLDNEQLVSLDEKPEPDTKTIEPAWAEAGLSVKDGVMGVVVTRLLVVVVTRITVRRVEAESPVDPIAAIAYCPSGTLATTNDAVSVPPEIEQVWEAMPPPDSKQVASTLEKPEPDTTIVDPAEAEVGLSEIEGVTMLEVVLVVELVWEVVIVLVVVELVVLEAVVEVAVVLLVEVDVTLPCWAAIGIGEDSKLDTIRNTATISKSIAIFLLNNSVSQQNIKC